MKAQSIARLAGLAYLGIIASGLTAELAFRAPIVTSPDPKAALTDHSVLWRAAMGLDLLMLTLDAVLAFLLFHLLRPFGATLAGAATALRLTQMAVIAAHLPLLAAALSASEPLPLMDRHALGYDLGLWFFGLNSLIMAVLLARAGVRWLSVLIGAAGVVYLVGTLTRLTAPDLNALFQPAYLIAVIAELSLTIWLLTGTRALTTQAQG